MAGSAVATGPAQAAPDRTGNVLRLDTVTALRALNTHPLTDGTQAIVAGYRTPGDGGTMALRWNRTSTAPHNGGTVIAPTTPTKTGRWH
ncbi:peptidase C14, partial [Streptomyces sp. or43]